MQIQTDPPPFLVGDFEQFVFEALAFRHRGLEFRVGGLEFGGALLYAQFEFVVCAPEGGLGVAAVEELAKEYAGKMKIGKLDVDASPKTATTYGVMSIPTLMFFHKGKVMDQVVGALNKAELKKKIEESLG